MAQNWAGLGEGFLLAADGNSAFAATGNSARLNQQENA